MFNVGDWVVDKDTGWMGYVTAVDEDDDECGVRFIRSRTGMRMKLSAIRRLDLVELLPSSVTEEDILTLQHLAVEFGDKDWFYSLSERLVEEIKE